MLPGLTRFNTSNSLSIYSILKSNFFNRSLVSSNSKDLDIGQLTASGIYSDCFSIPFLFNHIMLIIFVSTKEQMIRINTRWNIAMMTHKLSFWNRTYKMSIGKSMRSHAFTFPIDKSIIIWKKLFKPYPTTPIIAPYMTSKVFI